MINVPLEEACKPDKIRVLHVDDDPLILSTSKMILEDDGKFQVEIASNVDEALKKLGSQPFDAVISDYDMPQKTGLQFLEELRGQKNEIAFVMFTGKGREEVAVKALNLGADRYINKNGDAEAVYCELGYAISKIVERKRTRRMLIEDSKKINNLNEKLRVVGSLTRHDVRNKLSALNVHVFLLKKKAKDNPELAQYIQGIELASKQIVELLEFARVYEKLGAEQLSFIDVGDCINKASELADLKNNQIINQCQGLTVMADSLLRQLLYNLIDNTLRHGQNSTKICFHYEEDSTIKLIYEDDGVGIAVDRRKALFGERNGAGAGHGLYLVRRICETYGWGITEVGKPGSGVQFVISIPKSLAKTSK
jgi:Response regulator containing CheY-like receiver, AAA-type ATPase, and DNA-binding domains